MVVKHDCDILNWQLNQEDGVTIEAASYTTPAAGAPWVDVSEPESARFMGFIIDNVDKPSNVSRSLTQRISGSGGGTIGANRASAQEFVIDVFLFACDSVAMEYGMRYLTSSLVGGGCDLPCTLCEMEYRDSCPEIAGATPTLDEFNTGRWILKNVAVTKAPVWVDPPIQGMNYFVRKARFTIASELPWKFECPQNCVTEATFDIPTPTLGCGADFDTFFCGRTAASCGVVEPSIVGETGVIVEIKAGQLQPLKGIEIQIIPDERGWVCDPDSAPDGFTAPEPCDLIYIEDLPQNYRLYYNTATEEVKVFTNAGVEEDGTPYLTFDGLGGPPTYPVVRCGQFCVRVEVDECSVSTGAYVTIDTVHREL